MNAMNNERYDRAARYLHWASAAVIIWASVSGFYLATLDQSSVLRAWLSYFNVSLTTVFTPVFVMRLIHAIRTDKPESLDVPRWQQRAAHLVHALLYAVTSVVLASGLLMMDHAINVFGLVSLPNPLSDPALNGFFYTMHRHSCAVLFSLVVIHVAAVVRHQRAGRAVLARMS
jgi:cytochrome b561